MTNVTVVNTQTCASQDWAAMYVDKDANKMVVFCRPIAYWNIEEIIHTKESRKSKQLVTTGKVFLRCKVLMNAEDIPHFVGYKHSTQDVTEFIDELNEKFSKI